MSPHTLKQVIIEKVDLSDFIHKIGLNNLGVQIELDNKILISYIQDFARDPKINIAIAAAITANTRVYMSNLKNVSDYILYYTDTDSIFTNKPLPENFVNSKMLGLFKLEVVLTDFIALAPKVYGSTSFY